MTKTLRYIPALSFRWLTPLYDPLLRWGMHEQTFKQALIRHARIRPGEQVLDLGCGTGTLTLMLKQAVPGAHLFGLDGDAEILAIARSKSAGLNLSLQWDLGMAFELPYPESSFDVVVSSLVIHHLATTDKSRAFREAHRVLRTGGSFHIVDFGRPLGPLTHLQAGVMRNFEESRDNFAGRILPMLREAGFIGTTEAEPMNTVFGPIWFYDGMKEKG